MGADGRADLHVSWGNGDLSFYAGKGDGTFASPVRVGTGWGSMTRLLAGRDLDRDGKAGHLLSGRHSSGWGPASVPRVVEQWPGDIRVTAR